MHANLRLFSIGKDFIGLKWAMNRLPILFLFFIALSMMFIIFIDLYMQYCEVWLPLGLRSSQLSAVGEDIASFSNKFSKRPTHASVA